MHIRGLPTGDLAEAIRSNAVSGAKLVYLDENWSF
jgi:hypothetical protein